MIGWLAVITNSSLFVSTMLGMWIIPNLGWRYMFGIVGVGALVIWILRKNLPESPRWLEVRGRHEEARRVVEQMERESGGRAAPLSARDTRPVIVTSATPVSVWTVFTPPILHRTLLGILVNVVIGFCLYGFINWLPTFLVKQGVSIASSLLWLTVMALGAPAGAVLGLLLSDRVGRKPVIVGASLWAAALGALFAWTGSGGDGMALMVIGFLLFVGIYVILAVGFALHVPELFRTEYRLRGTAVCSTAGRIATACVQYVVVWLFALGGLTGVVSLLVGLLLVQAAAFALFGIETAGQPLEAIDEAPQSAAPEAPIPMHAAVP
jgi:putative MFS transporter